MKTFNNLIILLGAPGSGKGTQANLISKKLNIPILTMGDVVRYEIKESTKLGLKMKSFLDKGDLVPDTLVIDMFFNYLSTINNSDNLILDGFPRTLAQVRALEEKKICIQEPLVFLINIKDSLLEERLLLRNRSDDKKEVINNRLVNYHNEVKPILEFYKDIVLSINGENTQDKVFEEIISKIKI